MPASYTPSQTKSAVLFMAVLDTGSELLLLGFDKGTCSPLTLFNTFLERIMSDAQEDNKGSGVRIGGMIFINFRFPDEIVVNAEEKEEADDI